MKNSPHMVKKHINRARFNDHKNMKKTDLTKSIEFTPPSK